MRKLFLPRNCGKRWRAPPLQQPESTVGPLVRGRFVHSRIRTKQLGLVIGSFDFARDAAGDIAVGNYSMPKKKRSNSQKSINRLRLLFFLRVAAAVFLAVALIVASGYWLFVGWRARDLAIKARTNLENANYRMAWLQSSSARDLRPDEPEVLRTSAIIDAAFGRRESLDAWRRLADKQQLTLDDQEQRARSAIRFGDENHFREAITALEEGDRKSAAAQLRMAKQLTRGDLEKAIEEARRGAALGDDPRRSLDLARLLLRRYVDELVVAPEEGSPARSAFNEMTAIINSLRNEPEHGSEALAFGLTYLLPGAELQRQWADLAMQRMEASNPALLPAATVLVDNKYETAENLHALLRAVFDAAPLERRAAYAAWLTRHGLQREALTLITAQEAGENPKAFLARAEALGQMGNWDAVIVTAEAGGNIPESVRLITLARAQYALRSDAVSGAKSVGDALRAAAREQTLAAAVQAADGFGAQTAVSDALVELSGDPAVAGTAFRLARERFALAGDHARLGAAYLRARQAAPEDLPVRDYVRYLSLLADTEELPDLAVAEADIAAAPADPLVRITGALAKLRADKPEEALESFDDVTVFYDRLPPGAQAVICAVVAANAQTDRARALVRAVDRSKLTPEEAALIENLK